MEGWENKGGTHSRPSLGLDWKRSSGRNWSLFLFRRLWREKEDETEKHTYTHTSLMLLCWLSYHQPGNCITSWVSRFVGQRSNSWESLSGFLPSCGLQVITLRLCGCVSVTGYLVLSFMKPVIDFIPSCTLTWEWNEGQQVPNMRPPSPLRDVFSKTNV